MSAEATPSAPERLSLRGNTPDLIISCGNRTFKVHQEQLVGKPGILDAVRYEGIQDGFVRVQVYDIEPSVLSCILDFFYTGDFDETGLHPYIPSTVHPGGDGFIAERAVQLPPGSPSASRHRQLATVYTMAQKYKITKLKELVEIKFASPGKLSQYLSAILTDTNSTNIDMGKTLQAKLEKVALASFDGGDTEASEQSTEISDRNSDDKLVKKRVNMMQLEEENLVNPSNTPITEDPLRASALSTMEALNASLQAELESIRTIHEEAMKEFTERKSQLLTLKAEKFQAELGRDTALERLDGLMKTLNETKRCKNTGCKAPLNLSVQESEVRGGGNVTIRCGHCNARQR